MNFPSHSSAQRQDALDLCLDVHPEDPVLDLAVTHALLREVASGERGATVRVFRPGPTLALGRLDALQAECGAAAHVGRAHGYVPAVRLGGGRAVVYDRGSVQLDLVIAQRDGLAGTRTRFAYVERLLLETFGEIGIDARGGELPGEYCAGRWSVHAAGLKLAGSAQRVVRGAALVTTIIPVEGGQHLRNALTDIYRTLAIAWRPSTCGAVEDLSEDIDARAMVDAVVSTLARHFELHARALALSSLSDAQALRPVHTTSVA